MTDRIHREAEKQAVLWRKAADIAKYQATQESHHRTRKQIQDASEKLKEVCRQSLTDAKIAQRRLEEAERRVEEARLELQRRKQEAKLCQQEAMLRAQEYGRLVKLGKETKIIR
ncbi:hypothetical protein TREMEDRAFT_66065 [Tremella mesenterica DSM 1558]|uniref:uncharacterized protein n=1 Tax=Tremella mesenterica (strain ATCC 24925 / CBS 8224 / DSM 1558 / NBRC 9311 / NRRL Y-6157 / RJB 2259-6 / UBC 559-6) TaxID=578456 RepID=UPI00032BD5D4|nr:uncharacterized protein TREMEDRAFT_66065 [Tremella mesenterica DSM 1558]EIW65976.1 hypothetical protein TREMEDRAFT_66065 [Tremella mesenterica DSM 1558]